ncbi:hypothetical protein Tsp_01830 [Trichinella spiralis]|uniref:hypothetical protein n=1 Tax=Trichinella spiralis TaxID=6334 RepID=UPI0001EFD074|nr:hypothetical protein Tsp_01830 [Trichinella spiralis]
MLLLTANRRIKRKRGGGKRRGGSAAARLLIKTTTTAAVAYVLCMRESVQSYMANAPKKTFKLAEQIITNHSYFVTRFQHPGRSDESDDAFFKQYGRTVEQGARPVSRDVALLTTCRQSAASRKQLSNLT